MRKFNIIAAILGLGLGFAAAAPAANAASLIPEQEGEIQLKNLQVLDPNQAIDTSDLGFSVTSLMFDNDSSQDVNYGLSRLFVDAKGTENDYGNGFIRFGASDGGTTEEENQFWLRAAAIQTDGVASEGGELEVGRFLFEFEEELNTVSLDFFDTESSPFSGILEVNGQSMEEFLEAGEDGNTQTITLNNVSSFVIQLGKDNGRGSGDGVTLSGIQSVPEPTTTISLGALAVAGMFGVKKRKNLKK
ncbi:MAG: LEVG family PEP-CTERM protein [Rivularia sp. ALOHA_DT_140]|nr:LEVG family PEP-CTERM protein [Rivularia sp. ALOHA_DT_140]